MPQGSLQYKLGLEATNFTTGLGAATSGVRGFIKNASRLGNIITGLNAAKGIVDSIWGAFQEPITLAADMEAISAEMRILTGSGAKAAGVIAEIQELGRSSPIGMEGLLGNAKTMLSFGVATEKVMPTLRMLADVAGSSRANLDGMSLAFAQISSAGRLTGQDLMQLVNAGFNPLNTLAKRAGKTVAEMREEMSKGRVSADDVFEAFRLATSAGGMFFGNTSAQAQTFHGRLGALRDAWDTIRRSFATPIMESLKPTIADTTDAIRSWVPTAEKFGKTVATALRAIRELWSQGELGTTIGKAFDGAVLSFITSFDIAMNAIATSITSVLSGAFKSAVALLNDKNLWIGLQAQTMAIALSVKNVFLEMASTVLAAFGMKNKSAAVQEDARKTKIQSGLVAVAGQWHMDQVDWDGVMKPISQSVKDANSAISGVASAIQNTIAENEDLQEALSTVRRAARLDADPLSAAATIQEYMQRASKGSPILYGVPSEKVKGKTLSTLYGDMSRIEERQPLNYGFFAELAEMTRAAKDGLSGTTGAGRSGLFMPGLNTPALDKIMGGGVRQEMRPDEMANKLTGSAWARALLQYVREAATGLSTSPAGVF